MCMLVALFVKIKTRFWYLNPALRVCLLHSVHSGQPYHNCASLVAMLTGYSNIFLANICRIVHDNIF